MWLLKTNYKHMKKANSNTYLFPWIAPFAGFGQSVTMTNTKRQSAICREKQHFTTELMTFIEEMRDYVLLMLILLSETPQTLACIFHADFFQSGNVTEMMAGDRT